MENKIALIECLLEKEVRRLEEIRTDFDEDKISFNDFMVLYNVHDGQRFAFEHVLSILRG